MSEAVDDAALEDISDLQELREALRKREAYVQTREKWLEGREHRVKESFVRYEGEKGRLAGNLHTQEQRIRVREDELKAKERKLARNSKAWKTAADSALLVRIALKARTTAFAKFRLAQTAS